MAAVVLSAIQLAPELAVPAPSLNDDVLHRLNVEAATRALLAGSDPTDPWLPGIALGFPLAHHYQHLPYLLPALLAAALPSWFSPAQAFLLVRFTALIVFPLSIYWATVRFGFDRLTAGCAALVAPLLATTSLYGFDLGSYVWRGSGLYTQAWAMVLMPPALAQGWAALRSEGRALWAALLLAGVVLSHLVLGYATLLTLAAFLLVSPQRLVVLARIKRLALMLALLGALTAYFALPFLADRGVLNRSVWEAQWKYDSFGAGHVLSLLVRGELFDTQRLPIITALVVGGLLVAAFRWRQQHARALLLLTAVWLALFFGRPTWGPLLDLLPMSRDLHLHRMIAGVHLAGILLAGLCLATVLRAAVGRVRSTPGRLVCGLAVLACLAPAGIERSDYLSTNARWMAETRASFVQEGADLSRLVETLHGLPPGRVHAGFATNWGAGYRVGQVPMYAVLNTAGFDCVGFLFHALSLNAEAQPRFDERRIDHYQLFNVRYLVVPQGQAPPAFARSLGAFGRHTLYEVTTGGYFDVVESQPAVVASRAEFQPATQQLLAGGLWTKGRLPELRLGNSTTPLPPDAVPAGPAGEGLTTLDHNSGPAPAAGWVTSQTASGDRFTADVTMARPGTLVLKATYHPGWRVLVDGQPAATVMLLPSLLGIPLAQGTHTLVAEYQPPAARGWLQLLAVATVLGGLLATWQRQRAAALLLAVSRLPGGWGLPMVALPRLPRRLDPGLLPLLACLLAALMAGAPLLSGQLLQGHDTLAHFPRHVEFLEGLRGGALAPRWAPDLAWGYGEPTFNYNPPLLHYLVGAGGLLGLNLALAENLTLLALLLLAAAGMYLLGRTLTTWQGGVAAALAYVFSPYLLATLYVRHALPDYTAMALAPYAVLAIYRSASGRRSWILAGAIAWAAVVLSSLSVTVMLAPVLVLLAAWRAWMARRWQHLLHAGLALLLGSGLSAFFWAPALLETGYVHIARRAERLDFHDHFVELWQSVNSPWGYGGSVAGPGDGMSFQLGPVQMALAALSAILLLAVPGAPRWRRLSGGFFLGMLAVAVAMCTAITLPLWELASPLHPLQFPWRFLTLAALAGAVLSAVPFLWLRRGRFATPVLMVAAVSIGVAALPWARPQGYLTVPPNAYTPAALAQNRVAATAREFEPVWVRAFPSTVVAAPIDVRQGSATVAPLQQHYVDATYRVEAAEDTLLRINTFYFPGWLVELNGSPHRIQVTEPEGLMELALPPGAHTLRVVFRDTTVRAIASAVSWGAVGLVLLASALAQWRRRRRLAAPVH